MLRAETRANDAASSAQNSGDAASSPALTGSQKGTSAPDRLFVGIAAGIALLLATLPYLSGWRHAGGRRFLWLGDNLNDGSVYLAWMRQAADGRLFGLDLFTTEPQQPLLINPVFLLLGLISRFTGLSLITVFHLGRLGLGLALLLMLWKFLCEVLPEGAARRFAFLFGCFGAGFGWLPVWGLDYHKAPIDLWMPEVFTLHAVYFSPLFGASLLLQIAIFYLLLRADRTGRVSLAAGAGACGFLLALAHPYNIVSEAAVWGAYLLWNLISPPEKDRADAPTRALLLRNGLVAGLITLPALLYMAHQLRADAVFQQTRPDEPSNSPFYVALGFGALLLLAAPGVLAALRRPAPQSPDDSALPALRWTTGRDAGRLLIAWATLNVACAYLPFAFQRRVMQGAQFPIAALAGIGAGWLLAKFGKKFTRTCYGLGAAALLYLSVAGGLGIGAQIAAIGLFWWLWHTETKAAAPRPLPAGAMLSVALSLTLLLFLKNEADSFQLNSQRYALPGEIDALNWIRANAPPDAIVQPVARLHPQPDNPVFADMDNIDNQLARVTPEMTGRRVYYGHEAETIREGDKMTAVITACSVQSKDAERRAFWRETGIRYLIFSQKGADEPFADAFFPIFRGKVALPPYMRPVYQNADADVYEIDNNL